MSGVGQNLIIVRLAYSGSIKKNSFSLKNLFYNVLNVTLTRICLKYTCVPTWLILICIFAFIFFLLFGSIKFIGSIVVTCSAHQWNSLSPSTVAEFCISPFSPFPGSNFVQPNNRFRSFFLSRKACNFGISVSQIEVVSHVYRVIH